MLVVYRQMRGCQGHIRDDKIVPKIFPDLPQVAVMEGGRGSRKITADGRYSWQSGNGRRPLLCIMNMPTSCRIYLLSETILFGYSRK